MIYWITECNINVVILRYCIVLWLTFICRQQEWGQLVKDALVGNWLWLLICKNNTLLHSFVRFRLGLFALCTCPTLHTVEKGQGKSERKRRWGGERQQRPYPLYCTWFCQSQLKKSASSTLSTYYPYCFIFSCPHGIIRTQGCLCA